MSGKKKAATPVRNALQGNSALLTLVADGLAALANSHRGLIAEQIRASFIDSLEIDENLRKGRDQEYRWDYLLGHAAMSCVVGLEPHSAKDDQIHRVIRKKQKALEQLRPHLRDGAKVAEWFWVASSGKNRFADTEKTRRQLDQNGIKFVCPQLAAKHMDELAASRVRAGRRKRGR